MKDLKKIIFLGEECTGKSTFLNIGLGLKFNTIYNPTIQDYITSDQFQNILFIDTAGSPDLDRLRPSNYYDLSHIVLCFSIPSQQSFIKVSEKWMPEISYYMDLTPITLLGLKQDLRTTNSVTFEQGNDLAKEINATRYFECSALNPDETRQILESIVVATNDQQSNWCHTRNKSNVTESSIEDGDHKTISSSITMESLNIMDHPSVPQLDDIYSPKLHHVPINDKTQPNILDVTSSDLDTRNDKVQPSYFTRGLQKQQLSKPNDSTPISMEQSILPLKRANNSKSTKTGLKSWGNKLLSGTKYVETGYKNNLTVNTTTTAVDLHSQEVVKIKPLETVNQITPKKEKKGLFFRLFH